MPGGRLSLADRQQIAAGLADGLGFAEIARLLGRPTSTITREVSRNGGARDYRAGRAHQATKGRSVRKPVAPRQAAASTTSQGVLDFQRELAEIAVQTGLSPMAARVLACLYTTDSGSLTAGELVAQLRVSPASVSKAIGDLERQELVRRERDPKLRRDRYVIDGDVWYQAWLASAQMNAVLAEAVQRGAEVLGTQTPAGARLHSASQFLSHVGRDMVRAAEKWRKLFPQNSG
ncbi:GbsR/MarR family transcriptional regulator [Catelliglobosispora koreensis]|uniref:GbsR/MarR family transcriptional regulator n=1 Tax=Catelliglobosispora koreensis TaxID=129052 RepID=UPI00038247C6